MGTYGIVDRLKHAWSAFNNRDPTSYRESFYVGGSTAGSNMALSRFSMGVEKSIIAAVYTRIAIDVSEINVRHVRVDENGRFMEEIRDGLNDCLVRQANLDQAGKAFIQDVAMSLFDNGVVAIVPVRASADPTITQAYDVEALRTGKITAWYPEHVRMMVYNEHKGEREEIVLPKSMVAIVVNPLYPVMNEESGCVRRLVTKMNQLDAIDKQSSSGKLDVIISLPYTVRNESKRALAEQRRKDIEMQLTGSKYGIAYIDGTERVTQLNRPVENNLMQQVEYLTTQMYNQLGVSQAVFDGTAEESVMLNYYNNTIAPVLGAICDAMTRTFISKTAYTQGQRVMFYRDPFRLAPVSQISEMADKLTRNEIMSTNEIRSILGMRPSDDPRADELRNKNLNAQNDQLMPELPEPMENIEEETSPLN